VGKGGREKLGGIAGGRREGLLTPVVRLIKAAIGIAQVAGSRLAAHRRGLSGGSCQGSPYHFVQGLAWGLGLTVAAVIVLGDRVCSLDNSDARYPVALDLCGSRSRASVTAGGRDSGGVQGETCRTPLVRQFGRVAKRRAWGAAAPMLTRAGPVASIALDRPLAGDLTVARGGGSCDSVWLRSWPARPSWRSIQAGLSEHPSPFLPWTRHQALRTQHFSLSSIQKPKSKIKNIMTYNRPEKFFKKSFPANPRSGLTLRPMTEKSPPNVNILLDKQKVLW